VMYDPKRIEQIYGEGARDNMNALYVAWSSLRIGVGIGHLPAPADDPEADNYTRALREMTEKVREAIQVFGESFEGDRRRGQACIATNFLNAESQRRPPSSH